MIKKNCLAMAQSMIALAVVLRQVFLHHLLVCSRYLCRANGSEIFGARDPHVKAWFPGAGT